MKTRLPSFLKTAVEFVGNTVRRLSRDNLFAYAGQASFFIVISAIPFFLLLSSVLRIVLPQGAAFEAEFLFSILPRSTVDALQGVYRELSTDASVPLLSLTAVVLLWASSRGVRSLCEGVRNIYGTRFLISYPKKYLQSLFLTGAVVILSAGLVCLVLFRDYLVNEVFGIRDGVLQALSGIRFLIAIFVMTTVFSSLFTLLCRRQVGFFQNLPGALFASLGWCVFSFGYTLYVDGIANVTHIYGNLSALVLLMLWVYFCMSILLIGAELNVWLCGVKCASDRDF